MNLTFAVNSTDGAMQCLDVNITDDSLVEGNEMFTITPALVTIGLGVRLDNDTITTIAIIDNEGQIFSIHNTFKVSLGIASKKFSGLSS